MCILKLNFYLRWDTPKQFFLCLISEFIKEQVKPSQIQRRTFMGFESNLEENEKKKITNETTRSPSPKFARRQSGHILVF